MGAVGLKRKALESATPSKSFHVTPLGNTIFSSSYTVVGIKKPNGGYGKGLMHKPAPIGKGPAKTLAQKPLMIRRFNKPSCLRPCSIFESRYDVLLPPRGPTVTSLNNKIINLHEDVRILKGQLVDSQIKIRDMRRRCLQGF
jgi:hypothetical protein